MLEKKFRAWAKGYNCWCYRLDYIDGVWLGYVKKDGREYSTTDLIIEQYTGLKDKNDKEIYGGDIAKCYSVADEPCLAVVRYGLMPDIGGHEYCPCKIGFYLDDEVYFDEDFGEDDDYGDLEIIGNIHENGDLLGDINVTNKEEE